MFKVFLLAGQSNMKGAASTDELPGKLRQTPNNVHLFEEGEVREVLWRDSFGPEVGFAQRMGGHYPEEDIYLCKVAVGGSNLYYDWNPDGKSQGPEDDYRGPLYPALHDSLQTFGSSPRLEGEKADVAGMLWMQGERDSVFESMANSYEVNLRKFISANREDVEMENMPFIQGLIAPRMYDVDREEFTHAYRKTVQNAQRKVAESVHNVALIETMDLPQSDNLHFSTGGQIELGRRFAAAFFDLT